jgi:hypothetical protein
VKLGRISPSTNGEKDFEMSVSFLEQIDSFEVAVEAFARRVVPGVTWIVDIFVRPNVRKTDLARLRAQIGKGIEDMASLLSTQQDDSTRDEATDVRSSTGIDEGRYFRP